MQYLLQAGCVMAELPSGLLEACVVVGVSSDKLRDIYQKRRERTETVSNGESSNRAEVSSVTEDISVPKDLDLIALPQLCFPGGLQLASEQKEETYHFLIFTDLFGNRTHGVVVQYYRSCFYNENGHRWNVSKCRLFTPFAICIISKFPYYNALRDCLSCLLVQLRPARQSDFEEKIKEFSAKLSLVPLPPPGQLHVSFNLQPLLVVLPSREDQDSPVIDLDLHLPFLCFSHATLLQILSCLLQEQRMVFFSSDWSRLTLVAESLLLYLQPLSWQQPYVPVLARGMLDFLMAPTAFLMGCHISHFEEVAALHSVPLVHSVTFLMGVFNLQIHYDLELCHLGSGTDVNVIRTQRRDWLRRLNTQIQNIALELVVNIFKGVQDFLNHEHRVFNSEEFLRTREPPDQLFYKKVMLRPSPLALCLSVSPSFFMCMRKRRSVPILFSNVKQLHVLHCRVSSCIQYHYLRGLVNTVSNRPLEALEDFQSLYKTDADIFPSQMVKVLVNSLPESERMLMEKRPEIKRLISRLKRDQERERAENGKSYEDRTVKRFKLPKTYMHLEEFVKCVQESGIVKDQGTIQRLFDALTVGHQKQVSPDLFRVFYTIWKETEAEAQEVTLPASVLEHIEPSECVFKLSSSVKTSRGVGKIAMTQRRLFLLTDGRPGYVEVAQYRDVEEVKVSSAPILLLRIPSLKLRVRGRKEAFEANLKTETELWNLMVKEMWAGRIMADQHKDPQYMQQALTNALLMDAVVGSLQNSKAIFAASKLAHFDRIRMEVPMMVPTTTAETLKHKINPSLELTAPHTVDVLLYTPGKQLWVSVSGGKVMVFDASTWSLTHTCQVGTARLNCMLGVDRDQVWMGSEDSVIYIISLVSMVCNRQLTEHRAEVTGLKVAYSCSAEGTVMLWDIATLEVCFYIIIILSFLSGSRDCVMEVFRSGNIKHRLHLPEQQKGSLASFSSILLLPEIEEMWSICADSGEISIWHMKDTSRPFHRVLLPDCIGCHCIIKVKNQVWIGGLGRSSTKGKIYILDAERHQLLKELHGHTDKVTGLCSAEDRYVLSGAAKQDGKIAIWKVE
uniref:UDENN domain-containing protein n=1 Tax=Periophthalmus magnuspinnatus TaxID=409849 RepID=A0A3B4BDA8_9GOBI